MSLHAPHKTNSQGPVIPIGNNPPDDFNVIVEIPFGGPAVKYEIDKQSGRLIVDRYLGTPMTYPGNYGFIPDTLSLDGDPIDVLICDRTPLVPGAVINCRTIGVLVMEDEAGMDEKIIAVPSSTVSTSFEQVQEFSDLPMIHIRQIQYFFEHYKDMEAGKWVEVKRWDGSVHAKSLIAESIELAKATQVPKLDLSFA